MPVKSPEAPILSAVRRSCERLAQHGWARLLKAHGLDICADDLQTELSKTLPSLNRGVPGFEDFALEGLRAIEPHRPAWSLLYHAFASPNVLVEPDGTPLTDFPTLPEIEAVEDYLFGIKPPSVQDLRVKSDDAPLAIVVFSLEYRTAIGTVHQRHADLCFSRTGVARIGTQSSYYDRRARGFTSVSEDTHQLKVVPCRYAPFIAAQYPGDWESFGPMRFRQIGDLTITDSGVQTSTKSDADRQFWVPLHKLFSGAHCIRGYDVNVALKSAHLNQKLRKVHLALLGQGENAGWSEPDLSQPPFSFSDNIAEFDKGHDAAAWLMAPIVNSQLIAPAQYKGRPLTYRVPKNTKTYSSSLNIPAHPSGARSAPEYVHARHEIDPDGKRINLNTVPNVVQRVHEGGYNAQHYIDFTGDGFVDADCPCLALEVPRRVAAYSLISPPDYFPFVKQQDLMDWWQQSVPSDIKATLWPKNPGPPRPLSDDRYPGNLTFTGKFAATDDTISAIVSMRDAGRDKPTVINPVRFRRVSSLPDRAAGVFAPGWDCSIDRTEEQDPNDDGAKILPGVTYLAAYGLGSPFPEDAKLCAALSSFWPAAAPDVTRTFEPGKYAVTTPLPDDVIGQGNQRPWDGIPGPKVDPDFQGEVAFHALAYGDWVEAALDARFEFGRLSQLQTVEYESRTLVMARVYEALGALVTEDKKKWCVLSFVKATEDQSALQEAETSTNRKLTRDHAFRFIMFQAQGTRPHPKDFQKLLVRYDILRKIFADPLTVLIEQSPHTWNATDF
jgi:hypothetical protein